MKCFVEILRIKEDSVVVALDDATWQMPLSIFPTHSRVGDILQLHVSFCPFKTLTQTK